ncbi:acetylglutamate kinase [candidate division WOR-1 bacterium RIFOXYB2_FULL_42_35]|uniref:Acetylglutamate kinase n=1 Tax=candidate division WOR-1 bacterium RIFOXYC2_FULL_41_25 TaxID=1802586 RepID=A0A1F4TM70_UNCSA|nr:MAG: acetylglutamate kinase [candidate division WOR-1 bacterium RIFOXYA2_FULL_41_14]OGC22774.1 MAG: acetylglutamate kinase [candidate division WOR-1 bacterium RIFOXYB2_FULL_42_35]OGC33697.1 MAG: acetylglutamate kinase [candidate division WOR-1 bacterium RIFOXYC2_FULL_41_25]OGC42947.1 MAG: acetylglutamate kinase [candidate division WOR-1 bacterium RIFOXYD2_FULL_41_8]
MPLNKYKREIRRAKVVMEALPYLIKFNEKVVVIKHGGSAMTDPDLKDRIIRDVVLLKFLGMHPVLVHGGGPEINRALKRHKIEPRFVQGLRVSSKQVMKVVERILGEKVNQGVVALIKKNGGKAKGFYGKKGKVIKARKQWVKNDKGNYVDLGFTGHVAGIRYRFLNKWMKNGYIPVLAPIGIGPKGNTYNINADTAAASIAGYLGADKLILVTNVRGVLDKDGELVSELDTKKANKQIESGIISGGMIPKVKCCLQALKQGVEKVHIIDGHIPHAILLELFTDYGIGTMVVK